VRGSNHRAAASALWRTGRRLNIGLARRRRNIGRRHRLDVRRRLIDRIGWPWDGGWLFKHVVLGATSLPTAYSGYTKHDVDPSRTAAHGEPCAQSRKTRRDVHDDISSGKVNARLWPVNPGTQHRQVAVARHIQIENSDTNCSENGRAEGGSESQAEANGCRTDNAHSVAFVLVVLSFVLGS